MLKRSRARLRSRLVRPAGSPAHELPPTVARIQVPARHQAQFSEWRGRAGSARLHVTGVGFSAVQVYGRGVGRYSQPIRRPLEQPPLASTRGPSAPPSGRRRMTVIERSPHVRDRTSRRAPGFDQDSTTTQFRQAPFRLLPPVLTLPQDEPFPPAGPSRLASSR